MELNRTTIKFMEGTVPSLTRAIEGLTKKLDAAFMVSSDAGSKLDAAILDLDREDDIRHYVRQTIVDWESQFGNASVPMAEAVDSIKGVLVLLGIGEPSERISEDEAAAQGDSQIR